MIDERDKTIIGVIQGDLPLKKRPFAELAESIGITEDEFLLRIRSLKEKGIIDDIAAQILVNPALDLTPSGGSYKDYKMCVDWYLKSDKDSKDVYTSPLLAKDFSKLPKTLVITCEDDALKDEGKKYFKRLKTEGNEANYLEIPGEEHLGPLWAAAHPKAKSAMEEVSKTLTQVFYQ